jgi:hypothetical protein
MGYVGNTKTYQNIPGTLSASAENVPVATRRLLVRPIMEANQTTQIREAALVCSPVEASNSLYGEQDSEMVPKQNVERKTHAILQASQ